MVDDRLDVALEAPGSRQCGSQAGLAEAVSYRNDEPGRVARQDHVAAQGSTTSTPASSKSRTLRVATAMRRERAMAAIWQSAGAMVRPVERRQAAMSAYARAAPPSNGSTRF